MSQTRYLHLHVTEFDPQFPFPPVAHIRAFTSKSNQGVEHTLGRDLMTAREVEEFIELLERDLEIIKKESRRAFDGKNAR